MASQDADYLTRATLFDRLRADDTARRSIAWEEFSDKYAPIIAGFSRKLGVTPTDIDDIVQEVTLQFFESSRQFVYDPAKGRFRGYLKTVTYRTVRDRLAQTRRSRAHLDTDQIDVADPHAPDLIDQLWDNAWEKQRLNQALKQVGQAYQNNSTFRAFVMHVIEGQSVEDTAAALQVSADSVYKAKQRITAALREEIQLLDRADP
jgi:RNA polymerase sigma-70 factor, ECF subfamily